MPCARASGKSQCNWQEIALLSEEKCARSVRRLFTKVLKKTHVFLANSEKDGVVSLSATQSIARRR